MEQAPVTEIAVFAGGCFWCIEAVFALFQGVQEIIPGYTGGHTLNPCYNDVCTGETGHAEAVKIIFNPLIIRYTQLLEVFFSAHNPTTIDRQGADSGTQYRSAIFYTSPLQEIEARNYIQHLAQQNIYDDAIVTEIFPLEAFYDAEKYHHNYFKKHPEKAYCQISIRPKLEKVQKKFDL